MISGSFVSADFGNDTTLWLRLAPAFFTDCIEADADLGRCLCASFMGNMLMAVGWGATGVCDEPCMSDTAECERVLAATTDGVWTQFWRTPEEFVRVTDRPAWLQPTLMPAFVLLVIAETTEDGATDTFPAVKPDSSLYGSIC